MTGFVSGDFCGATSVVAFRWRVALAGDASDWAKALAVNNNVIVRTIV
jgi:hypothetical protein